VSHAHVFTVASGFGLRVVPVSAPYELAIGPEPNQLDVERSVGQKRLFVRVTAVAGGGYTSKLAEDTTSLFDVVDIVSGPAVESWWLETGIFHVPLPDGWRALASGAVERASVFDLIGPENALIFVQIPDSIPSLDQVAAPGQRIHQRGAGGHSRWIELRYEHEGREWTQRHDFVDRDGLQCIVTSQWVEESCAATAKARDEIVGALRAGKAE
jgi:hypothetical protein